MRLNVQETDLKSWLQVLQLLRSFAVVALIRLNVGLNGIFQSWE